MSNKNIKYYSVFISILILIVSAVVTVSDDNVNAANSQDLTGWAWSSNVGWISFNCINENSCTNAQYNVAMASGGALSGYAWNSNIGWISFNQSELSGCPSSPCTASVNQQSKLLEGWAKALSADNRGWDGWISLSGSGGFGSYGPVLNDSDPQNSIFTGYAWGSDVVGWLKFDPQLSLGVRLVAPTSYFSLQKSSDITTISTTGNNISSGTTTISVSPVGNFSDNITLLIQSSSVTGATYKINGNICTLNVVCDTITSSEYTTGVPVYIEVSGGNSGSGVITILGEGAGFISTVDVLIDVTSVNPIYNEF